MNASNRPRYTRQFYIICLLARTAAFLFLVGYALAAPESFQADLTDGPFHITPLTAVWTLAVVINHCKHLLCVTLSKFLITIMSEV